MATVIRYEYGIGNYTLECEACKKHFVAKRRDAKTCSANCRKWLSRADERKQTALAELHYMAVKLDQLAENYGDDQQVYDQMVALYKLTYRTLGKFKTAWRQLEIPDDVMMEVKN